MTIDRARMAATALLLVAIAGCNTSTDAAAGVEKRAAERWTEAELVRAQRALRAADRRVKTGGAASVALLAAIAEACPRGGSRTAPRPGR